MSMESLEAITASIEKRMGELEAMASDIVDRYWEQVMRFESSNPGWKNKSGLRLRCYRKGNYLRIEWTGLKWYGAKAGGYGPVLKYIPKGKGAHIYPLSRIFGYAKEWEKPLIEETEKELAWIRREAFHLNKALFSIRYAKAAAMQGEVVEE